MQLTLTKYIHKYFITSLWSLPKMNVFNFKIQNLKCYKIQNFLAASVFVIQISRVWGIWGVSDFQFGNVPPVKSIKNIPESKTLKSLCHFRSRSLGEEICSPRAVGRRLPIGIALHPERMDILLPFIDLGELCLHFTQRYKHMKPFLVIE